MESRDVEAFSNRAGYPSTRAYLARKLDNKENLYNGKPPLIREKQISRYQDFIKQFSKASLNDEYVLSRVTAKDFIVDNNNVYIVFLGNNKSLEEVNGIKVHLTQNFLVNWDEYDSWIKELDRYNYGHLTVSTITGDDILEDDFGNIKLPKEVLLSDIQFIKLRAKDKNYRNGYYHERVEIHIGNRNSLGLITILLFYGTKSQYLVRPYNEMIEMERHIIELDLASKDRYSVPANVTQNKSSFSEDVEVLQN